MKNLVLCISLAFAVLAPSVAHADGSAVTVPAFEPGAVVVDAGVALDATPPDAGSAVVTPASQLHNPVDDPLAALDDAKQAKKQGWAPFLLTLIILVTTAFAKASTKWPTLPVLSTINKHKTVIFVVACLGVGAGAVLNAWAGGSWYAAIGAGSIAVVAFINAAPSQPAQAQNAQA